MLSTTEGTLAQLETLLSTLQRVRCGVVLLPQSSVRCWAVLCHSCCAAVPMLWPAYPKAYLVWLRLHRVDEVRRNLFVDRRHAEVRLGMLRHLHV